MGLMVPYVEGKVLLHVLTVDLLTVVVLDLKIIIGESRGIPHVCADGQSFKNSFFFLEIPS